MSSLDYSALTKDTGMFNDIFQLPYIAGIVIVKEYLHGIFAYSRYRSFLGNVILFDKITD